MGIIADRLMSNRMKKYGYEEVQEDSMGFPETIEFGDDLDWYRFKVTTGELFIERENDLDLDAALLVYTLSEAEKVRLVAEWGGILGGHFPAWLTTTNL
jgi:hypothetical protein